MVLTEIQLLSAIALVTFLVVSIALFFMERNRSQGIKPRITFKNILAAIFFGLLMVWLAWLVIHGTAAITGYPAPLNYSIRF